MFNELQIEILKDCKEIEEAKGNPSFVWGGKTYVFIPSPNRNVLDLAVGGFTSDLLLTGTVRLYDFDEDEDLIQLFPTGTPNPQETLNYRNRLYRIESVTPDDVNATFDFRAVSPYRGV